MNKKYKFPAVKGVQAKKEYYISMIPIKHLIALFPSENEYIVPELRAQRKLNTTRIPEITNYILSNRGNYVFSALAASIDGKFKFISMDNLNVGILEVDEDAKFLLNDGQHRKAAIEAAFEFDPSIGEEDISIVLFKDAGLFRSQQMFTDLNKHVVKTSNSLATLYDSRDEIAVFTRELICSNPFLNKYTDKERDVLGKNSSKLFTVHSIYKANQKMVSSKTLNSSDIKFMNKYWKLVVDNIVEWNMLIRNEITKKSLREDYIVSLSILIVALGKLGGYFRLHPELDATRYLNNLQLIDWSRKNKDWYQRVIKENGNVNSSEEAIVLTYLKIKDLIGLELTKEEKIRENKYFTKM